MTDEQQHDDEPARHFYVTPAVLPQPNDTDTEWIQRVTMLASLTEEILRTAYNYLQAAAPILVGDEQPLWHLMAGAGLLMRGVQATGSTQLEKRGLKPLDAKEEQLRIIRNELARPDINPELREALLGILADNLRATPPPAEDNEWPAEGVVIGGDDEQS